VVGIFSTSIAAGQAMSRTGRYKAFPILGAGTVTVALVLLSRLEPGTPYWQAGLAMWVLGAGLGFTMQVIVTVVQNSVERRHMGTATSAVTFFRMMGGAFGTALFGAVLSSRLATHLTATLPPGSAPPAGFDGFANNVQKIAMLPEPIRVKVVEAFDAALGEVFLSAVPAVLIAFVVAFFITEVPLKSRESEAADAERDDLAAGLKPPAAVRR
jgi:MFS family permease